METSSNAIASSFPRLSSDEAPDTADDSDEDLVTSYIPGVGIGHPGGNSSGHPIIRIGSPTTVLPDNRPILEDNLQQLKSIQDQIQKMRVENKKQAAADLSYPTSSNSRSGLINLGMHLRNRCSDSRLSSSCPALNNTLTTVGSGSSSIQINQNDNYDAHFDMNSNYNSQQSPSGPLSMTPGHASRRRKNNDPNNPVGSSQQSGGSLAVPGTKGHRKRQGHHRQRSTSLSSGDSDLEDLEDRVDGRYDVSRNNVTATGYRTLNTDKASQLRYNQHHHRSSSTHASSNRAHSSKSHTAPIPGLVVHDGSNIGNLKNGNADHSGSSGGIADIHHQMAQNRKVNKNKNSYLSAQSPLLQKSISTPSIAARDQENSSHSRKGTGVEIPEPTHLFLERLISDHQWGRRGGSNSDSESPVDEEGTHAHQSAPSQQPNSTEYSSGAVSGFGGNGHEYRSSGQMSGSSIFQNRYPNLSNEVSQAVANATPSPQLSLAEFLHTDPNLEKEGRRKKERSSIFSRKKKDKNVDKSKKSVSSNHPSINNQGSHSVFDHAQVVGSSASVGPDCTGSNNQKSLGKVSSSINLGGQGLNSSNQVSSGPGLRIAGGNSGSSSLSHHYSMSSLRKGSVTGPLQSHHSSSMLGSNSYLNAMTNSSNFYIARGGEISSPCKRAKVRWNKVGRKLGVIKTHDDREDYIHDGGEMAGLIESEFVPSEEFPEGGPAAIRDLDTHPYLRIQEEEAETWQQTVRTEDIEGLTAVDKKRQEHIYEVILTESNHCQVLKVIQKIFVEGMYKYLNLSKEVVERIFPCIDKMIDIHFPFLEELRIRQNEQPVVSTISDILYKQFSGKSAEKWRDAYGAFCSSHEDAVNVHKDLMKSDRRYQQFMLKCSENPLLKKKGVPECVMFVTGRIMKYPLLLDALIKTAKDKPADQENLVQAKMFVKHILRDVNATVADKERKARFLEIYQKLDPKSKIFINGRQFKKSDLLADNRKLMFEGVGNLQQSKGRSILVNFVVLSDIVIFLQENNQKYMFITPENKPSTVRVRSLLAREKPGGGTKSLIVFSSPSSNNPSTVEEPEKYDIEIIRPSTRDDWISGIRCAVDAAPAGSDSEEETGDTQTETLLRDKTDSKHLYIRRLTAQLREKDLELAKLLEDKMKVMKEMVEVVNKNPKHLNESGGISDNEAHQSQTCQTEGIVLPNPEYLNLVREQKDRNDYTKEQLLSAVHEASRLASSLYSSSNNLSRSASSVGERQSQTFTIPLLPKRAETFSGFDQTSTNPNCNEDNSSSRPPIVKQIDLLGFNNGEEQFELLSGNRNIRNEYNQNKILPGSSHIASKVMFDEASISAQTSNSSSLLPPPLLSLDPLQQQAAFQMTHYLNSLMCMVSEHFTSLESLKFEIAEMKEKSRMSGGRYIQNQQLEELRNRQETLTKEQRQWNLDKERKKEEQKCEEDRRNEKREELEKLRSDVEEQRDQLYRKLDALRNQGIELGPNLNVIKDPNVGLISTVPHVNHSLHTVGPSSHTIEKGFYHGDHSTPDGVATNQGSSMLMDKTGMPTSGTGLLAHNSSSSSIGVRKASSMSGVSIGPIVNQASSVATGGSLKKDSFSTNLHLLSATNETKQSVVGLDKQDIQQKIPEKLVSKLSVSTRGAVSTSRLQSMGGSERMSKKNMPGLTTSSSGISPSGDRTSGTGTAIVGNLAKPESISQLLPFKLSQAGKDNASQQQQQQLYAMQQQGSTLHVSHSQQQGSPGRQKLSSSSFGDSSSTSKLSNLSQHPAQYSAQHQPQLQNSACYQYPQNQHNLSPTDQINMSMRQRTGSSPHLASASLVPPGTNPPLHGGGSGMYNYKPMRQPPIQIQQQQRNNSNTLPKKDGKLQKDMQKINYNNRSTEGAGRVGVNDKNKGGNGEDKVIYF